MLENWESVGLTELQAVNLTFWVLVNDTFSWSVPTIYRTIQSIIFLVKEKVSQHCNSTDRVPWDWLAIFFTCSDSLSSVLCVMIWWLILEVSFVVICTEIVHQYSLANLPCKLKTSLLAHTYFCDLNFFSLRKTILSLREEHEPYLPCKIISAKAKIVIPLLIFLHPKMIRHSNADKIKDFIM